MNYLRYNIRRSDIMFELYSTKDLYLVELRTIINISGYIYKYSATKRYTLAKKGDIFSDDFFTDILTKTKYKIRYFEPVGSEVVVFSKCLITDKKYLTKKEVIWLLQSLNPTYLKDISEKQQEEDKIIDFKLTKTKRKK